MGWKSGRNLAFFVLAVSAIAILLSGFALYRVWRARRDFAVYQAASGKLQAVLGKIHEDYVDSVSVEGLEDRVIPKLVQMLDPHSEYFTPKDMERVSEPLRGDFEGIGVTFNMLTDTVIVQSVIAGGPSEKAGIQPGDRFIMVDSIPVAGVKFRQDSIVHLLRGARGTEVSIAVERSGGSELIPFSIVRDRIPIHSIDAAYMADSLTGVIRVTRFARTTPDEFRNALIDLTQKGMQRLVLDLRDNGGGFLETAHYIAGLFLKDGQLITYIEGRNRPRRNLTAVGDGAMRNIPMAVLVNEFSASSSEIVAGALQDNDRAVIVGRRTFGKGLVQEQFTFPDGAGFRLTVARYYTPSGRCIQKPYDLGDSEEYEKDLVERWEHGEMYDRDSIHQDTMDVHYTAGHRKVYGGGGIMPDVFVPLDTVGGSRFLRTINHRALAIRFAQRYVDANRERLSARQDVHSLLSYLESQDIMRQFLAYARTEGVVPGAGELAQSGAILRTRLYAQIARGVLDSEGFYPIIQEIDDTLLKAVELLSHPNPLVGVSQNQHSPNQTAP